MRLELDASDYAAIAKQLAPILLEQLGGIGDPSSPWMRTEEAIAYSKIPSGTFKQLAAAGRIPSHGGRTKLFHRAEVDEAILGYRRQSERTELRRVS